MVIQMDHKKVVVKIIDFSFGRVFTKFFLKLAIQMFEKEDKYQVRFKKISTNE